MENDITFDTSTLEGMLGDLIQSIDKLDLSIDYLSAIMSGGEAALVGLSQGAYGRAVRVPDLATAPGQQIAENKRTKTIFKNKIRSLIEEEVSKFLSEKK